MRDALRRGLLVAMRSRDATAVSALRSAIAALDNAEVVAVETSVGTSSEHLAGAVAGLGAADQAAHHGQQEQAELLRGEAQVLQRYVTAS